MGLKKYIESPEKYTDIEQFIREFTGEINDEYEVHWGMEFTFRKKSYYLCRFQMESDEERIEYGKKLGRDLSTYTFEVADVIMDENDPGSILDMIITGWYEDVYDMLDNCIIDGMKLRDVLLSEEFIKTGTD